jgi:hypothetical protein
MLFLDLLKNSGFSTLLVSLKRKHRDVLVVLGLLEVGFKTQA